MKMWKWNFFQKELCGDKSCISLTIIHSKGIPLVKPYFAYISGISHSVDNNIDMT